MRPSGRAVDVLRAVRIERGYTRYAEGSVFIEYGDTQVICNATVERGVPGFLKGQGQGWLTAEYGMLPRSTVSRMRREASQGRQSGRTLEIQRLIGRVLRCMIDRQKLGEWTVFVDCDVIQADGGTRTASITGGCVAVVDALHAVCRSGMLKVNPLVAKVAAVSVGLCKGEVVLDMDYAEDSNADADLNIAMDDAGHFIEIQGTGEGKSFSRSQLDTMLVFANKGISELLAYQRKVLTDD